MDTRKKVLLEVMYKASHCLPCFYMDKAVEEILPEYSDIVEYRRIDLQTASGKERFLELSVELFGEEGVYEFKRIAPIPSLFINGELFFDAIPPRHELEAGINEVKNQQQILLEVIHEGEH